MNSEALRSQVAASAEQLYANGFAALRDTDSRAAQRHFGMLLALQPLNERPWVGLAAAREQLGDYRLAAGFYQLASAVAPRSIFPKLGRARALGHLGKRHQAEQLLDQAEALTDDSSMLLCIDRLRGAL